MSWKYDIITISHAPKKKKIGAWDWESWCVTMATSFGWTFQGQLGWTVQLSRDYVFDFFSFSTWHLYGDAMKKQWKNLLVYIKSLTLVCFCMSGQVKIFIGQSHSPVGLLLSGINEGLSRTKRRAWALWESGLALSHDWGNSTEQS